MRKSFVRFAVLASLAPIIAGCATTNANNAPPSAADFLARVSAFTQAVCGFKPVLQIGTALASQLMAAYFPAGVAINEAVTVAGNALCAAPVTAGGRRFGGRLMVTKIVQTPRGPVAVRGTMVR